MTTANNLLPRSVGASAGHATTLPALAGLGLKPQHFQTILETRPNLGFFEIHAENYMVDGGPFHYYLSQIRRHYPLSIHGVGLSIGGSGELDEDHLSRLATLISRYEPASFSEHLAWSSHGDIFLNDLLPLPYNPATLRQVCDHIDRVHERLGRRMLLENPATYLELSASTMTETDFLGEIVKRTGCGLLLDLNNVYVSCTNHAYDPKAYIEAFPMSATAQIHLAGFAQDVDASGAPLLIDSHSAPVGTAVWDLYRFTLAATGSLPTLIERDHDIPSFAILLAEAKQAECLLRAGSIPEAA